MAKLTGRGGRFEEIARVEKGPVKRVLRSDGYVLTNMGYGWKRTAKIKPGVTRDQWVKNHCELGYADISK